MRGVTPLAVLLACGTAMAQKPWEVRVDLPVPVPIELPAVPPTNPFAAPVVAPPSPVATPLREKYVQTFVVLASAYVDGSGTLRRLVFTRTPWPGIEGDLKAPLSELGFTPARSAGGAVPVWLPFAVDLKGRIHEGRITRLVANAPEPGAPPEPDAQPTPAAQAGDVQLPATPLSQVEQFPELKRPPRVRVEGRSWRQPVRLLVDVGADGRCRQAVFLACPEGLRPWLLASMAVWTFRPAAGTGGAVEAWALLEGDIEVEVGNLVSEALRIMRTGSYPPAAAPAVSPRPPGG